MKAREHNEVPRQPTKVHWDYLLEEAKVVRDEMHRRRRFFMEVASRAALWARLGWIERRNRLEGKQVPWAHYQQTFANVEDVRDEEREEAAKKAVDLAALRRGTDASSPAWDLDGMEAVVREAELPKILVTAPTPKGSEKVEIPVRPCSDLLR